VLIVVEQNDYFFMFLPKPPKLAKLITILLTQIKLKWAVINSFLLYSQLGVNYYKTTKKYRLIN
jgi:hypothetical protein